MPYLIGLDVGTTNLKAILYDTDRHIQTTHSTPTRTHVPRPGWAEYYADELWTDLASLLRRAVGQVRDPSSIRGIAVASMGEAGLLLDAHGTPLTPIIAWFDPRTEAQAAWWREAVGEAEVYAITGHPIHSSYGVHKLMWWRDTAPEQMAQAAYWLSVEDYVLYRLAGVAATDYSVASRTMAFDIAAHQWSGTLLERAGLDPRLMPPAYPGGTAIGGVTSEAANATGLPVGVPVVTGGHDHICASFAVGAFQPGALLDSTGTSEALILVVSRVLHSPDLLRQNFAQECHVIDNRYGVLAGLTVAGYVVEWLNRLLQHGEIAPDYGLAEAAEVPPGAEGLLFLPHLRGSGSPTFDPLCRGAIIGLTSSHTRGHLLRAGVEGVCYELKSCLQALESAAGVSVETIYATGKVTQSDLWLRTKADVTGKRLHVPRVTEAAGLGAALLAGLGAGVFATPEQAVGALTFHSLQVEPQPEPAAFYQAQYDAAYRHLYSSLREVFRAIGSAKL